MDEEWREVAWAPGYFVSSFGRLRSPRGDMRTPPDGAGYPHSSFRVEGRSVFFRVHVLVAEAFIGARPKGLLVAHADGVKANNRVENLRYATRKENAEDARKHGTIRIGARSPQAKLTPEKVLWAKAQYVRFSKTHGANVLAQKLGVSRAALLDAISGKNWAEALKQFAAMEEAK